MAGTITRWAYYLITCAGCPKSDTLLHINAARRKAEKHFSVQGWHRVGNRWLCAACWEKWKAERIAASVPERGSDG